MLPDSERMTIRSASGAVKLKEQYIDESILCFKEDFCPQTEPDCPPNACGFATILNRLAAYEDTRLSPDEVNLMKLQFNTLLARKSTS